MLKTTVLQQFLELYSFIYTQRPWKINPGAELESISKLHSLPIFQRCKMKAWAKFIALSETFSGYLLISGYVHLFFQGVILSENVAQNKIKASHWKKEEEFSSSLPES